MTTKDEAVAAAKRIKFRNGKLGPARDVLAMAEYLLSVEHAEMEVWYPDGRRVPISAEAATNEQGG